MSIAKSVRIPEDIFDYINDYSGKGFNQKYVNIIRDARDSEPQRNARLAELNQQILEREKYIQEIGKQFDKMASDLRSLSFDMTLARSHHII